MTPEARYGWESDFPRFRNTSPRIIRGRIQEFLREASAEQIRAWDTSIPELQREVGEVLECDRDAESYTAILEYELPMESRRPDVVLLVRGGIVVIELKGKDRASQADIDQAAAYARDLRCYHRECAERFVMPILVPTRARGHLGEQGGVQVVGPDAIDSLIEQLASRSNEEPVAARSFLSEAAYCPLPSLIEAARELFDRGDLRPIHRARAATDPAVQEISEIIHEAAKTRSRRLILLTGVPGSGKTLVGLRIVHAHFLDDLAVPRDNNRPTAPAVFLSGNGPLVEVLRYELQGAGGGGKAFVRGVLDYVKNYSSSRDRVPPEHVLVFDEAQRAFDAEQVQEKHRNRPGFEGGKSEPEHFIEFAERVPEWCVVIGLIGGGQEIHVGEEAGLVQWRHAIEGSSNPEGWQVHGPEQVQSHFEGSPVPYRVHSSLSLDEELRFHAARELHQFVANLLNATPSSNNADQAQKLERDGYHLRISRSLETARSYLRERYAEDSDARFGLVASSRDKVLEKYGIPNTWHATRRIQFGPWYSDSEKKSGAKSCRHLSTCVTEFGAQGLELDAVLLAWGTDLQMQKGKWSHKEARKYKNAARVRDPHRLRVNAYRVLLTRGRDGTVVFVPDLQEMNETYNYLITSGFKEL